jgi:tryptophan synthase alpha chain
VESVLESGVDGFLVPDFAAKHTQLARQLERRGVTFIRFLTHDPSVREVLTTAQEARGYVMLQANPGPTGAKPRVLPDNTTVISLLRRLGLEAPLALGIGISTPEQARAAIAMGADGVIIGSSIVEAMLKGSASLRRLLRGLRQALDE